MRMRVIGDDGAGCDVDSALRDLVRVDIAAEVAGSDLTRSNHVEVKESHGKLSSVGGKWSAASMIPSLQVGAMKSGAGRWRLPSLGW